MFPVSDQERIIFIVGTKPGQAMCTTDQRTRVGRKYYPAATIQQFLDEIAKNHSIVEVCADPKFPGVTTIYRWLSTDPVFAAEYEKSVQLAAASQLQL
ncbi:hypothetical protein [Paraburkholderia sp. DHOC27]|uniref:terminase small subunit-like protein n=1 Tax=Paraburkholderia sp. DHOC27 TaxID=2303330 RepID=UPI00385787E9